MRKKKSVSASICESRKIAMPDEINPHGTLFGGVIMSWIDKTAYMCAQNYAESKQTVTVNIDNIQFLKPVLSGDHVTLKAIVTSVGRSSMEIEVILHKEDPIAKTRELVGEAYLTFVSVGLDGKGKVVPELLLENDEDKMRNRKALIRIAQRVKLKSLLAESEMEPFIEAEPVKLSKITHFYKIKEKITHSKHLIVLYAANVLPWKSSAERNL